MKINDLINEINELPLNEKINAINEKKRQEWGIFNDFEKEN